MIGLKVQIFRKYISFQHTKWALRILIVKVKKWSEGKMTSITFPALLAGPIVRRVDSNQAYIWVATSQNYKIKASFFGITTVNEGNRYTDLNTLTSTQSISFGENLYIHLIKITPSSGRFNTNQLIGYNLHFKNRKESFSLDDLDLLNPVSPNSIVYGSLKYPCFYIKEVDHNSNQPSKFLFGSCRKVHGEGEDALCYGDRLLEKSCRLLSERPEALFLMGDQIYADDVPDPLFLQINMMSKVLMGKEENLLTIDYRLTKKQFDNSLDKINGRKSIIQKVAKFTSGNSYNHLIEFGEYAAMYLFAWSPVLWEICDRNGLFKSFDETVNNGHYFIRSKSERLVDLENKRNKKRYIDQEQQMAQFRSSTYKIRRLLANIPTYMIFDDHDITDDWNITAEWKKTVQSSPLGKHIVTNGLSAYWAFQGWGNDPEIYKRDFIFRMKRYFQDFRKGSIKGSYHSWVRMLWEHQPWYFVAPTTTKAVFLDTRTMREYEEKDKKEKHDNALKSVIDGQIEELINPPQLVNDAELRGISRKLRKSRWKKESPLLIVSPTPILGFEFIEDVVTKFSLPLKMLGLHVETTFDMEAWRYNGKGLTRILNQLGKWNPSQCIVLSGDVHYSFLVSSSVSFSNGQQFKLKQITSSPLKNMSFHKLGSLVKLTSAIHQAMQNDEKIQRYCDLSYQIQPIENNKLLKKQYLWRDKLIYEYVDGSSIIETENNLGCLSFSANEIKHLYIKKDEELKE